MEIRVTVPDEYIDYLKKKLGKKTGGDVLEEGLSVLKWAVDEAQAGRHLLSATVNSNGTIANPHRLTTPGLSNAQVVVHDKNN
jgi:hypothetical protein